MILHRLSQSLKEQSWTAIVIQFILLVAGVFLGIQASNWNTVRSDHNEYEAALSRLGAEIDANLSILDGIDPEIEQSLKNEAQAFKVLRSCVDSEENRRTVEMGLAELRGTFGIHMRRKALEEMTSSQDLLSQQSAAERQRFSEMLFYFNMLKTSSDFAEFHPLEMNMADNPIIGIGPVESLKSEYFGVDWTKPLRKLQLVVPVNEACNNNQLIKSFYTWESWQANIPIISKKLRKELVATKTLIEARQ